MASSEWMELESLSRDIADSQGRVEAAKSIGSFDLAQVIEQEVALMEERRTQVLAHLADVITGTGEPDDTDEPEGTGEPEKNPGPAGDAQEEISEITEDSAKEIADSEPQEARVVSPIASRSAAAPEPDTKTAPEPGRYKSTPGRPGIAWNQLTPADVERAKRDLSLRRAEMLARHSEELRTLEADKAEIDALEQAIDAFMRKFAVSAAGGEVVPLKQQRSSRLQAGY
jgi:hypothetical protein